MGSVPAPSLRGILRFLNYELMPGSNNPVSEYWISPEGTPFIFVYAKKGVTSAFLEQPVREFLRGLSTSSLHDVKIMLDN